MHAKHLLVHSSSKRQEVKYFCAITPDDNISVLLDALLIEAVHLRDLSAFVVSSDQCDAFGISDLEGKEEDEDFD